MGKIKINKYCDWNIGHPLNTQFHRRGIEDDGDGILDFGMASGFRDECDVGSLEDEGVLVIALSCEGVVEVYDVVVFA